MAITTSSEGITKTQSAIYGPWVRYIGSVDPPPPPRTAWLTVRARRRKRGNK